jgi:ribosome maturation protein SDO1
MLRQPVSQVPLTNVSIVRLRRNGIKVELACYPNKVSDWRDNIEKDLDEVLQSKEIFSNVQKGVYAKQVDLHKAFGKAPDHEIIETILKEGELQVNELERKSQQDSILKDIAIIISEKCVDAQSGCPVPYTIIMRALEEIHVNTKTNQPAKKQALIIIKNHKEKLGLERAKMRIRLTYTPASYEPLKELINQVTPESTREEANIILIGLIQPENYRLIFNTIKEKHLEAEVNLEVLDQRVVVEGEGKLKSFSAEEIKAEEKPLHVVKTSNKKAMSCSTCPGADFNDVNDHRNHFKTVWHKYNIKRKSRNVEPINEPEFSILSEREVNELLGSKVV